MVQYYYNYSKWGCLGLVLSLTLSSLCLSAHSRLHVNDNEEGYFLDVDSNEGGTRGLSVTEMGVKETERLMNNDKLDVTEPDPDGMMSNTDELASHITPAIHGATPSSASLVIQPSDSSSPSPSLSPSPSSSNVEIDKHGSPGASDDANRLFSGLVGGGGGGSGYGSGDDGGYGYGSGGDGGSGYGRGSGHGTGNGGSRWGGGSGSGQGGRGYGSGGGGGYGYGSGGGGNDNGYGSGGGGGRGGPGIIDESPGSGSSSTGSWLLMANICKMFCN